MGMIWLAGAGMQWALAGGSAGRAFGASASALTTLGLSSARGGASAAAYIEAVLGIGLIALVIAYLPSLYAAFSRREALVSKLAMRTGLPQSPGSPRRAPFWTLLLSGWPPSTQTGAPEQTCACTPGSSHCGTWPIFMASRTGPTLLRRESLSKRTR
jgi:hypothetical protein